MDSQIEFRKLTQSIISCRKCPRLVAWREVTAREKRKAYMNDAYWGKPVPGFGDTDAKVLIIGLAPGAHGSNRTGRMFTGDASGEFLFKALYDAGFCSAPISKGRNDGLYINNIYITAICRCVPPGNKPTREEIVNCSKYLEKEMRLLNHLEGIVALGKIAFDESLKLLKKRYCLCLSEPVKFKHNDLFSFQEKAPWLLSSYHPSRQNTQTGRLTSDMFSQIWVNVKSLLNAQNEIEK